jgi:hypothetical protein
VQCAKGLEVFVDVAVELVGLGVFEYLLFFEGDQGDGHVEQVVLVFFVHEEVEDFVDQRNLHVPELP